ncbi:MAG: hypothetical protein SGI90_12860 [Candidatus Eisenbacteria bacterium]|nr:hypothetical protein [Candidatus Eisenbacteria bacterium]
MMAYIPSSQLYHSALADFLAANANAFSAHSHSSPGAARMENQLIRWMADLIGLRSSMESSSFEWWFSATGPIGPTWIGPSRR